MIRLDNITLNPSVSWLERYNSFGIAQKPRVTLGGRTTVHVAPLSGGRVITLAALQDSGWLNRVVVEGLLALAAIPGKVMLLTYHGDLDNVPVVFRHHEPPALELKPLLPRSFPLDGDYFIGTIKLMQV